MARANVIATTAGIHISVEAVGLYGSCASPIRLARLERPSFYVANVPHRRNAAASPRVTSPRASLQRVMLEDQAPLNDYRSVSPPDTSETFCLPAETKGIMARRVVPIFSIG